MANQERAKGSMFTTGAPTREKTAPPVSPKREVKQTPKLPQQEKAPGKRMPKVLQNAILGSLVTLAALEGAGATTTELTDKEPFLNNPAYTSQIVGPLQKAGYDALHPLEWIKNISSVPTTFDSEAGKTKFGENNVTEITPEEAQSKNLLEPKIQVDSTGIVTVTTLMPGIFPANVPDTELNIQNHAEKDQAPFTDAHFIMPDGYQLTLPKGTYYTLLSYDPKTSQQPSLVYDIISYYYDKTNDISFTFGFEATGLIPGENQKIIDRKTFNSQYNPTEGGNYENLPKSDGITPIAKPSSSNQDLQVFLFVEKGKFTTYSPDQIQTKYRKSVWENFIDQNQKLILISSK